VQIKILSSFDFHSSVEDEMSLVNGQCTIGYLKSTQKSICSEFHVNIAYKY